MTGTTSLHIDGYRTALAVALSSAVVAPSLFGAVLLVDWTDTVARGVVGLIEAAVVLFWVVDRERSAPALRGASRLVAGAVCVWLAASVASTVVADQVAPAVVRTAEWLLHVAFGFTVWAEAQTGEGVGSVWRLSALVGVGFVLMWCVALWARLPDPSAYSWGAEVPFVLGPRWLGTYSLLAVTLGAMPLVASRSPNVLAAAWMTLGWMGIWWSGSRGAAGAALCSVAVLLVFSPQRGRVAGWGMASVLAGAALSVPLSMPRYGMGIARLWASASPVGEGFGSGRSELWSTTWDAISENLWFGIGPDGLAPLLTPVGSVHAHNSVFQALAEWGFVGGVPFLVAGGLVVGVALRSCWLHRGAPRPDRTVATAYLVAVSLNGMFEGVLYNPPTTLFIMAAAGVALADGAPTAPARRWRYGRSGLAGIALTGAVVCVLHLAVLRAVWAPGVPAPDSVRWALVEAFPSSPILSPLAWWGKAWISPSPDDAAHLARWGVARNRAPWTFLRLGAEARIARSGDAEDPEAAALNRRADQLYLYALRNAPPWRRP